MVDGIRVKSVNWHMTTKCNYNCLFCFSRQLDPEIIDFECAQKVLKKLKDLDIEKLNFTGGEPLLHPLFHSLVKTAKEMGFIVSIVSNGYYLNADNISDLSSCVDWIGISVDSSHEDVELALGRGNGSHVEHVIELVDIIHEAGIKLKINSTITRLNWNEDMRPFLKQLKPDRWKIFQVLHIGGQNDLNFNDLSITDSQFNHFKSLNQENNQTTTVFEGNNDMIDSYFMLSPAGMVMSNRSGDNRVLTSLANLNHSNISKILNVKKYAERGGIYSW